MTQELANIPILHAAENDHQFVIYGDSCSGVPGAPHEATLREVNQVLQRLDEPPQFICFPGDEIMGLTADPDTLRQQWAFWFEHEMAWLDREQIPLYHTTGNHTTYNQMSEDIFREVLAHLPKNGPADQQGLSYFVRRGDLLMIFVHTLWSQLGGEGYVETEWLDSVLSEHADAQHKLVLGHHPVFPVNGFAGDYQRTIVYDNGRQFWDVLKKHQVLAYVCSHLLAFDIQVHNGIFQICTAGAGTAHRMPEGIEYLHAMQVALDSDGLRYQVLDTTGEVREWFDSNWQLPPSETWQTFDASQTARFADDCLSQVAQSHLFVWEFSGQLDSGNDYRPQTLLSAYEHRGSLPQIWVGITGHDRHLMVSLRPQANRSPHSWYGSQLPIDEPFTLQVALHSGMGPGGILWRWDDDSVWQTLVHASAWGVERLSWAAHWFAGTDDTHQPFRGSDLSVRWYTETFSLDDYSKFK